MDVLVTGGAGFIGRWVVQRLLQRGDRVRVLDDLSNGRADNLAEFQGLSDFSGLEIGSVRDGALVERLFQEGYGLCIHAGTGRDIAIRDLARLICPDETRIVHVPHPHPQSEIPKLVADSSKARALLGWSPTVALEEGLRRTEAWIRENAPIS